MMHMMRNLFTGADNVTHDLGRVSWCLSSTAVVAAAGANRWYGAPIDLMQIAEALSLVATAHGAALFIKRDTEPKP